MRILKVSDVAQRAIDKIKQEEYNEYILELNIKKALEYCICPICGERIEHEILFPPKRNWLKEWFSIGGRTVYGDRYTCKTHGIVHETEPHYEKFYY